MSNPLFTAESAEYAESNLYYLCLKATYFLSLDGRGLR
jgi:hypothetical protein